MRTVFRTLGAALALAAGAPLFAAAEAPADMQLQHLARKIEAELTGAVTQVTNAFVFVGGGSGVAISPDGDILTNHHVAGTRLKPGTWTARVNGTGRLYVCDVIGTDPVGDLCLLKARDAQDLPYVRFGDIDTLRIGQQCLTVGDPFKLADPLTGPPAVSLGTISLLHRFQQGYSDAIQTDAAINLGNSGGPLVTLDGKLIGITGQIMARFGVSGNTGIGYAIPIDQIERFLPILRTANGGVIYHGDLPQGLKFTAGDGDDTQIVTVEAVESVSEADNYGFRAKDKILEIEHEIDPVKHTLEHKPVLNYWRLRGIVQSYPEQTPLTIVIDRGGNQKRIPINLPRMPIPPPRYSLRPLGIDEADMAPAGDGVLALRIIPNSAADHAGMQNRDVILKVDGKRPPNAWADALANRRPGDRFSVQVRRGAEQHTFEIVVPPRE
jgi:S1-C subfamily serine protease